MESESTPEESPQPPPSRVEELVEKIQELELVESQLKEVMSKLNALSTAENMAADHHLTQRSNFHSPQRDLRWRSSGAASGALALWNKGLEKVQHPSPLQRESHNRDAENGSDVGGCQTAVKITHGHYLNILQSIGHSVHIMDLNYRITFWNTSAENLYGYSAKEALEQDAIMLLTDPLHFSVARNILRQVTMGEIWTGKFPFKKKGGDPFLALATNTPLYDGDGTIIGVMCISSDSRSFQEAQAVLSGRNQLESDSSSSRSRSIASAKFGLDPQKTLQAAITSNSSNSASKASKKVKSKMGSADLEGGSGDSHHTDAALCNHREDATSSGPRNPRGDIHRSPFEVFSGVNHQEHSSGKPSRHSGVKGEGKPRICNTRALEAEAWIGKKGLTWPWKGNESDGTEAKSSHTVCPLSQNDQENEFDQQKKSAEILKPENQFAETNRTKINEVSGSWSSINTNSTCSASSCESTSSSTVNRVEMDTYCLDCEILWEDLTIGEQIGKGSYGIVYHAQWGGSDVAVKLFSAEEYTEKVISLFKHEVSLMKRLRHPNILLFMGAVTSPQRLCIVTEFLHRGSLFQVLHRNKSKLDWKRRIHMALDIARGMNYLHHCNPSIIHRDLKSSNLLVDKNWTVKVADFGLSCLNHDTYLTPNYGKGTPQWMAPEQCRCEPSDEKADVFGYGVILWELNTLKIPWDDLHPMQVIGAVGYMDQRLEIPKDVDPLWASIVQSCWHSEPQKRPSFQELMERLIDLHRQHKIQIQAGRVTGDVSQKEM